MKIGNTTIEIARWDDIMFCNKNYYFHFSHFDEVPKHIVDVKRQIRLYDRKNRKVIFNKDVGKK